MWIITFAVTGAIAVALCIAAIVMQPKRMRGCWRDALMHPAPPARARPTPESTAQEYAEGENAPRPVDSSLADRIRGHYHPVLNEPLPARLLALIRRL